MSAAAITISLAACENVSAQPSTSVRPTATDCSAQWTRFSQKPGDEGAFPDTQVSYYRYMFKLPKDQPIHIRVSGVYPNGRYMGYNLYDPNKMDSVAGISDQEIKSDVGYDNPFQTGLWQAFDSYTLWFDPQQQIITQDSTALSSSTSPTSEQNREIWYRIYDPKDGPGATGAVALPRIETFDARTGAPVACPEAITIEVPKAPQGIGQAANLPPGPDDNGNIRFVHHNGMGLYANRDTNYVSARLKMRGADEDVAVIKFKAPRSAQSIDDLDRPGLFDVRYWSFCIGSALSTTTSGCVSDSNAKVDESGFVTIVIASRRPEQLPVHAHYLERVKGTIPIMIYRNLLPTTNFTGDLSKIPIWQAGWPGRNADEYAADKFIGTYAPIGKLCSLVEFNATRCQITH